MTKQEITEILADLLSENYDCAQAARPKKHSRSSRRDDFQLVISDITMPGMSGLEMIPHVKSHLARTPWS